MYITFSELLTDKDNIKKTFFLDIAVHSPIVYKQKNKFIQFILTPKINKLWHYFHDNMYYGLDIEARTIGWYILNDMGYYEYTNKPTWNDFKLFLGNVIYEYKLVKEQLLILTPLHYKISNDIDKEKLIFD